MPPQDRYDLQRKLNIGAVSDREATLQDWHDYLASRESDGLSMWEGDRAEPLLARGDFALPRPHDIQPSTLGEHFGGSQGLNPTEMGRLRSKASDHAYPSGLNDALRLENASRMSNENYVEAIKFFDAEENKFQEWYRSRAFAEGLSMDAYDPLHMFDYKAYWRQLQRHEEMMKGMSPDSKAQLKRKLDSRLGPNGELPSEFDWKTEEGEAEVISRAKEAFGKDWEPDTPPEGRIHRSIEDIRKIEEAIERFYNSKTTTRKKFPLVKFKPGPPDPGGRPSYFETPIIDKGAKSIQEQSEIEYNKLLAKKSLPKKGEDFKEIGKQPPDPHPKDIKPDPYTGAAPPEVAEELGGMDPEIMLKLRQNPQLRSIFGLE